MTPGQTRWRLGAPGRTVIEVYDPDATKAMSKALITATLYPAISIAGLNLCWCACTIYGWDLGDLLNNGALVRHAGCGYPVTPEAVLLGKVNHILSWGIS
jgi:hypothetical protein